MPHSVSAVGSVLLSGGPSGTSSSASSLASMPSPSPPLSPLPPASPSAAVSPPLTSLLPSLSVSVAHPSTVLSTFAAPSLSVSSAVAHKERSVSSSTGVGRLIPRIFTGRRRADRDGPDSSPRHSHTAPVSSERTDGEQTKESEETKELSGEEPSLVGSVQPLRGKVKSNSIVPQPISPRPRQSPSHAGSALLEWKEGSPSALPALPGAPSAALEPIAQQHSAASSASVPLSLTASPAATESLPPLRPHHSTSTGTASLPRLSQQFSSTSLDSSVAAPSTSAATSVSAPSASHELNTALPSSLPARLAPHILLTSSTAASTSAPATERNGALTVPSVSPSPSPSSLSPSPSPSTSSKSSHRTSIAQYIDYERRHAAEAQYHLHRKRQHQLRLQQSKQTGGEPDELQSLSVVYLPRGGIYVHTPAGPVQFGMPPETIKDSMALGLTLPAFFVVPKERFNLAAGINVAEFEFPAYYNFFFKRRRINLITTHSVEPLIRTIFRETLLGPSKVEWPAEYGESVPKRCYPDLQKEMGYFSVNPFDKSPLTVDSLLAFTHFDADGRVQLEQGVAIQDAGEEYVVTVGVKQEDGSLLEREIARVRQEVFSTPLLDERDRDRAAAAQQQGATGASSKVDGADSVEYFVPPQFGLTMLGNSDGFDSTGTTTGFVLWMNRRGIMVDPPPHSGALLKRHGISARLMRGVILTHCFPELDTRVLTNRGLLFLDEIEALQKAGQELLFGCYDKANKTLQYSKGTLVIPEQPPTHLLEFTSEDESAQWTEASGPHQSQSRHVSLRVTPGHNMFVQLGNTCEARTRERRAYSVVPADKLLSRCCCPAAQTDCEHRRASIRMLACAEEGYVPQFTERRQTVQRNLGLTNPQFATFVELLGFWLGDAALHYSRAGNDSVVFKPSKQTDLAWLKAALSKAGLEQSSWTRVAVESVEHLHISAPVWFAFFDAEFGGQYGRSRSPAPLTPLSVTRSSPSTSGSSRRSSFDFVGAVGVDELLDWTDEQVKAEEARQAEKNEPRKKEKDNQLQTELPPAVQPYSTTSVQHLPEWVLAELSAAEMRLLIAGLHRADGSFGRQQKAIIASSARFRDELTQALLHCGYSVHSTSMDPANSASRDTGHDATAGAWKVYWVETDSISAEAFCWPSMSRQQSIARVPYSAACDGRVWCVEVEHADHLIIAQRAERDAAGIVTKQSRPLITGNCHADHDAGTFQKILEEGKVVLMTTEVILDSFIRKYSAISGLDAQFLRKLFVFRPVLVGQRTAVYGGHVEFFYSLHSIPCVGFSAYCLAEGTRVTLSNQTSVTIQSISNQQGTAVLSYDATQNGCVNKLTEAPYLIDQGMKQCVELVLEDGRKMVCTDDHRLITLRGEVKVAELTQQDRVLVAPEGPLVHGGPQVGEQNWQLDFDLDIAGVLTHVTCPINQPDGYKRAMSFARLLGYIYTDGTIKTGKRGIIDGRWYLGHLLDAQSLALDLSIVLGVPVAGINIGQPTAANNTYYVDLPHRLAWTMHHQFGCALGKKLGQGVGLPPILLAADTPIDFIRECLGAIFGGDGGAPQYVPIQKKFGHIKYYVSVPEAQRDEAACVLEGEMLAVLGLFGVTGTITEYACKGDLSTEDTWQVVLNLPSKQTLTFADNVGFRYCIHKQQRLNVIAGYYRGVEARLDQKRRLVADAIRMHRANPGTSWRVCIQRTVAALRPTEVVFDNIVEQLNDNRMRAWAAGRDQVGNHGRGVYKTATMYVQSIGATNFFNEGHAFTGSRQHVYSVPRHMLTLPTWHLAVEGTRPVGAKRTYDLAVADTHLFVANGMIAHNCNGRSFVYSADSFNDPAGIRSLHEKGYVSEGRRDKLIHFPWHHDLILHEAGVPPIHTPLATLEALPDDVKQRLYIVHKPSKDVPADKGLKSALVGPQNTLLISADIPPNGRALEVLDLLSGIELFSGFDLSRALEILQCASFVSFNKADTLIAEGTYGNAGGPPCMYVIAMGTVSVEQDGQYIKQLTVGDHFGEMSIITGEKRTASVKALTPVEVIQFSKQEFLYMVRHTDAISRLQQLGVIQRSPSWQAISANSALSQLSSAQKTYLQSLFVHRLVAKGDTVWQASEPATEAVLIADGQFYFSRAQEQPPFTRGALVGEMRALIAATTLSTTLQCDEAGSVFAITRPQLCKFFDDNPGVQILFMNRRFIE